MFFSSFRDQAVTDFHPFNLQLLDYLAAPILLTLNDYLAWLSLSPGKLVAGRLNRKRSRISPPRS
jgi:hypothetical protein